MILWCPSADERNVGFVLDEQYSARPSFEHDKENASVGTFKNHRGIFVGRNKIVTNAELWDYVKQYGIVMES